MKIINLSDQDPEKENSNNKITDIKQGVKNPNRVNVFVNDKYSFSLDISQVVDFKIKIGQEVTPEKLAEYKSASEYGKLYQRTLEWVLIRPRSVRETRDYLYRKIRSSFEGGPEPGKARSSAGRPWQTAPWDADDPKGRRAGQTRPEKDASDFTGEERPEEDISNFKNEERVREEYSTLSNQIITRLTKKGYLNDQKFAEYYVENRFVKKGISKKRLRMELIKKGIANDTIEQVLNRRSDEEEILKIIRRKRAKYDDEKLISYLIRQGFGYQLVQTLVRETDSQNSE